MRKLLGITLGIMTALGGFVDLGQIVFTTQAGALFGYKLLWAIVLGTIGVMGKHANGRFVTVLGMTFLVLITLAAIAAIPLMILTHSGQP